MLVLPGSPAILRNQGVLKSGEYAIPARGAKSFLARRQRRRHTLIAGKHQSLRSAGIHLRLFALHKRLELVILFAPRANAVPAHAVVHRQLARSLPTILHKRRCVQVAVIKTVGLPLRIARRNAEQKIRNVQARLRPVESEAAVEYHIRVGVDLADVELAAGFQSVRTQNAAESIGCLADVLRLHQRRGVHTHGQVVERHVGNAFG